MRVEGHFTRLAEIRAAQIQSVREKYYYKPLLPDLPEVDEPEEYNDSEDN